MSAEQNTAQADRFAAAEEQALSGWTDDGDDAVVETAAEDEPEAADDVDDQPEAEDEGGEAVVEDSPEEDQPAAAFDPAKWDGNMASLPESIKPTVDVIYKEMERGLTKKFTEVAQLRKQLETKLAELRCV